MLAFFLRQFVWFVAVLFHQLIQGNRVCPLYSEDAEHDELTWISWSFDQDPLTQLVSSLLFQLYFWLPVLPQLLMALMTLPPFNVDFSIFLTRLLYSLHVFYLTCLCLISSAWRIPRYLYVSSRFNPLVLLLGRFMPRVSVTFTFDNGECCAFV